MRALSCVLLLSLFPFGALAAASAEEARNISWIEDPSAALREAERTERLVLVDAWAPWCAPCFEMEKTTWKDAQVREAVEAFVRLKINHDVHKLFVERYAIEHLPILLVLDPSGEEITRAYGYQSAEQVHDLTTRLVAGYPEFAAAVSQRKDPEAQARAAEFLLSVGGHGRALEVARKAVRRAKADPQLGNRLRLALGEAQLGEGQARAACKTFQEVAERTEEKEEARGRALLGLLRAERERGREDEANAVLQQLRASFPKLAEGI